MKHRWLEYHVSFSARSFWLRLFGYGPFLKRDRILSFSERYGYQRVYRFGRWSISWLKPIWQ